MTTMRIVFSADSVEVTMDGHAGFADSGSDVVCAAASTLALCLHAWAAGQPETAMQSRTDGHSHLLMERSPETATAVCVIMAGAACIANDYPEYFRLEVIEQ